jgi:hypothetical protein
MFLNSKKNAMINHRILPTNTDKISTNKLSAFANNLEHNNETNSSVRAKIFSIILILFHYVKTYVNAGSEKLLNPKMLTQNWSKNGVN